MVIAEEAAPEDVVLALHIAAHQVQDIVVIAVEVLHITTATTQCLVVEAAPAATLRATLEAMSILTTRLEEAQNIKATAITMEIVMKTIIGGNIA